VAIRANFDGSGKNESATVTVGGIVLWEDLCSPLEAAWNEVLVSEGYCERDGTPGVFHLADFGTPYCHYGTGQWDIKEKRIPFLKKLVALANRKHHCILSFSVDNEQFGKFLSETPNKVIYGPEYFSAAALMIFVYVEVVLERIKKTAIAYFFEHGDRQHELKHSYDEYISFHPELDDYRSLHFVSKKTPLLQMSDLIAGKVNEVAERAVKALGFIDGGGPMTPLSNFERYYSYDGTTQALLEDGGEFARHDCYVLNRTHFDLGDKRIMGVIWNNPKIIQRRISRNLWIPTTKISDPVTDDSD
jgi:hypothetical protein